MIQVFIPILITVPECIYPGIILNFIRVLCLFLQTFLIFKIVLCELQGKTFPESVMLGIQFDQSSFICVLGFLKLAITEELLANFEVRTLWDHVSSKLTDHEIFIVGLHRHVFLLNCFLMHQTQRQNDTLGLIKQGIYR